MKNLLTTFVLVIVAAGVGAIMALQPWFSETDSPAPVIVEQVQTPVAEIAAVPETEALPGSSDSDSKKLSIAVDILKSLNARMGSLEDKVSDIEQDIEGDRLDGDQNIATESDLREERIDDETPTASELTLAQARKDYFQNLEQSIAGNFDEQFSQEITNNYTSFLSTGEAWTEGVSVNPSECSGEFCKVVVNYPSDMDPTAQFELDGRVYLEVSKQLPQSKSIERTNSDGTKEIVIYFAKDGVQFPQFPN